MDFQGDAGMQGKRVVAKQRAEPLQIRRAQQVGREGMPKASIDLDVWQLNSPHLAVAAKSQQIGEEMYISGQRRQQQTRVEPLLPDRFHDLTKGLRIEGCTGHIMSHIKEQGLQREADMQGGQFLGSAVADDQDAATAGGQS